MDCVAPRASKKTKAAALASLPDDMLAAILSHLPPRSIAMSRFVCTAWRALVDEHRVLAPHLPHAVHGLFVNYEHKESRRLFFLGPTTAPGVSPVDGEFSFVEDGKVLDHCDGLVLYTDATATMIVCNPATRESARLPPCPASHWKKDCTAYLAFDPTKSPRYEVLVPPHLPVGYLTCDLEWPPESWPWHVFSSKNGQWMERTFIRECEAAGTAYSLGVNSHRNYEASGIWLSATHSQGRLYLHFREYVCRMSLSTQKYRLMKSPICEDDSYIGAATYLGKSVKGMYFATIHHSYCQLRVWNLHESHDTVEWELIHQSDLKPCVWWMLLE